MEQQPLFTGANMIHDFIVAVVFSLVAGLAGGAIVSLASRRYAFYGFAVAFVAVLAISTLTIVGVL